MIVKNESRAIKRCLESVRRWIDFWVIVDTGSTDGTQTLIREALTSIPGELYEKPWVDFAHNRNEALRFARGKSDYLLFIDADETFAVSQNFRKDLLCKECYFVSSLGKLSQFFRPLIVVNDSRWRWTGVVHETLQRDSPYDPEVLEGVVNHCNRDDGSRSQDPKKYEKDASLLLRELDRNQNDPRTTFYLAQSYANAGMIDKAQHYYRKRAGLEGCPQERYWARLCAAYANEWRPRNIPLLLKDYADVFTADPSRAEPLECLAKHCLLNGWYLLAYLLTRYGLTLSPPLILHSAIHRWVYEYGLLAHFADAARCLGLHQQAKAAYLQLLQNSHFPESKKAMLREKLGIYSFHLNGTQKD